MIRLGETLITFTLIIIKVSKSIAAPVCIVQTFQSAAVSLF